MKGLFSRFSLCMILLFFFSKISLKPGSFLNWQWKIYQGSDLSVGWRKNLPGMLNPFACQQAVALEFRLTPQVLDSERSSFFPPGQARGAKK